MNTASTPTPHPARAGWRWVPIRRLDSAHRARIEHHLLALGERDRYLRFGYPASDERIRHYVASIDFQQDEVFGIFDRRLQLLAVSHLACCDVAGSQHGVRRMAEFAVSVDERARGRGYGARLFDHAVRHARNHGIDRLFIHALSENTAMLRIARRAGAELRSEGGETEAWLHLPPDTLMSQLEELFSSQAAEIDYQSRVGQRQWRHLLAIGRHLQQRLMRTALGTAGR
ncbi:GNAT family N-acetyltransferase [Sphaerotilus uruguayifluvii]|uniref:RimJ/RimL family protein N-acetyltransferase n=1 Tax=Sphaerotilus uruguayifluvii TaxID=2735897 RepID=A0ABX2G097_9BURK|nr:GNAT family N-acetyltransferase [Leptothrix sp. C29]NRT55706.1 RimJ/RimL family protein N-acetyltransferase [Leptothrix sp. C29]